MKMARACSSGRGAAPGSAVAVAVVADAQGVVLALAALPAPAVVAHVPAGGVGVTARRIAPLHRNVAAAPDT